jgi:protein tyrosine phosphatase (PTP) superfamily phosphohydrolase (DUF442 family)
MVTSVSDIRTFHLIDERLGTAGQPTAEQLRTVRQAGFEAVINLALPTSDHALVNEGSVVTALGMTYTHIPVNFERPTTENFRAFCQTMAGLVGKRVFVHCAANKRVAAFVFLYRRIVENTPNADAQRDLEMVWEPDDVWTRFIAEQLALAKEVKCG